ncbi:MAG: M42 family metallopeptidase [Planctomycetota bacterium]|nr:M42 family metallopeptidase [Planctomycetota bacterium]
MDRKAMAFFRELMAQPTPSGYEKPGQSRIAAYMQAQGARTRIDVHGNCHGIVNRGGKIRVMLAGHCDEIGLMVMHIDEKGYIAFSAIGGVNVPLLQGERVTIYTKSGPIPGVIGVKPIHLMDAKERESSVGKIHDLWIDIGAKNKKDAEKAVALGDIALINAGWTELRNGLVACRAFDDRVGAFVIADVLRLLKGERFAAEVHAVATVQEEIGLRGAHTAAFGIDPHVGIAVDVGFATDHPGVNVKMVGEANLGQGPILHCGPNFNPRVVALLEKAAKAAKIKTQMQPIPRGSGTDANAIQLTRAGVAAGLVSVPTRYMHSPVEVVAIKDVEDTVRLLAQFIKMLKPGEDFTP